MNVTIISFDFWGFDQHIIKALKQRGIRANHINLNEFKYHYPTIFHRVWNLLSKLLFRKNIKKIKRQEFVVKQIKTLGAQDQVLVIRPDLLDLETHRIIKTFCRRYMAYLYDSTKRFSIDHLIAAGVFNKIYSFDSHDVEAYGFYPTTNYIYLPKMDLNNGKFKHKIFMVISKDERLETLNAIAKLLDKQNVNHKLILRGSRKPSELHPSIEFRSNEIWQKELNCLLDSSEVFLDIVRLGHYGLSFRVFEAMAHQKKLITTNISVKNYDFYNPNNILVIDPESVDIPIDFLNSPYVPIAKEIYDYYTVEAWVSRVFELT